MDWIEVVVNTPREDIDGLCQRLAELGCGGFVIEDEEDFKTFIQDNRQYWGVVDEGLQAKFKGASRIKFYLSDDGEGKKILADIEAELGFSPERRLVRDSDWENNWREFYKPIEVGERLVVVPEWLPAPDDGRQPLRLDPGLIFGTGDHPTTKLALAELEEFAAAGKRFLDIGCGSGILGIGALVLGAELCVGCDIDPMAPEIAMGNAALNGIDGTRFRVFAGDVLGDAGMRKRLGGGFDVVLANIVADVIIPLTPLVRDFMAQDGRFICSGIIDDRSGEVREVLESNGFEILQHNRMEEWNSFVCK